MKKSLKFTTLIISSLLACTSCGKEPVQEEKEIVRVEDTRQLSDFEYTLNNLVGTDDFNRSTIVTKKKKEGKQIGVFYHIWHGTHNTGIFNITELLETDPDSLYDPKGNEYSPVDAFHYWGEPLYGYYQSRDPWVITRHMELLTMAGIDYLVYDLTNAVIYTDAINAIFEVLDKYQKQGFDVPKVAFYTNSYSGQTMKKCYETWYKTNLYSNLWYSLDGEKPLIIGSTADLEGNYPEIAEEIENFFQIKESQWPYDRPDRKDGFPWMDWGYPQTNYNGIMSVSLAQHPSMRMSEQGDTNNGRGFDYETFTNNDANTAMGTNVEGQWKTAIDAGDKVNNVFVTGWNEWIAMKKVDSADRVFFVDTFNEAYSRDMEMCKDGYGDNFYLQLTRNLRTFAYEQADEHYIYPENAININDFSEAQWANVKSNYVDFSGDAMERNFKAVDKKTTYIDTTNRNDIVKTSITHDANNLYIKVETKENITNPESGDTKWMNVYIGNCDKENSFYGFNYVLNRNRNGNKCSIETIKDNFTCTNVLEAEFSYKDNVIQYSIPLSAIGMKAGKSQISVKIADNLKDPSDILDYYVSGDCAPIGRLGYSYGY